MDFETFKKKTSEAGIKIGILSKGAFAKTVGMVPETETILWCGVTYGAKIVGVEGSLILTDKNMYGQIPQIDKTLQSITVDKSAIVDIVFPENKEKTYKIKTAERIIDIGMINEMSDKLLKLKGIFNKSVITQEPAPIVVSAPESKDERNGFIENQVADKVEEPFVFTIDDIFVMSGAQSTMVSGIVGGGNICINDFVFVGNTEKSFEAHIKKIAKDNKEVQNAISGEKISILLDNYGNNQFEKGQTLTKSSRVQSFSAIQQVISKNKMRCPKCGSDNIQAVSEVQGKTKGYGCCSGGAGLAACGPIGLVLGLCGMGKGETKTDILWVCNNCGNKFK